MENTKIKDLCNQANDIFIQESLSGYPKYKYLPSWLKNKGKYLHNERLNPKTKYKVYKRSTIIYVDFGINVGSELSGNHFAIVVNNSDNPKNGVLCVIPISSKNKRNYISVGKILEIQSIKHFKSQADKISHDLRPFLIACVKKEQLNKEDLDSNMLSLINKGEEPTDEELEAKIKELNWDFNSKDSINKVVKNSAKKMDQYSFVFNTYRKYTKDSYAMPLNIQTISKKRIKRINRFDPSGEIKAPAEVMDIIDASILSKFTKN